MQTATESTPRTASISTPATIGVRQDVFSLAEGTVTIQWPASLSQESFQDLSDWLAIVQRKIGRSVHRQKLREERRNGSEPQLQIGPLIQEASDGNS